MNRETEKVLYHQLVYLAENFDFNDPEDKWARDEYREVVKMLGIPEYNKENRKRIAKLKRKNSKP